MIRKFFETLRNTFFLAPASPYYTPIVDISKWQGDVDFATMRAAGVELVMMRLSIGDQTDVRFSDNYAGARAAGLRVGVYHAVKPSISVAAQWTRIVDSLAGRALDVPLALDCEVEDGQNPSTIATVIEGLAQKYALLFGEYPLIYTRATWWNVWTIYKPIFKLCPLWVARYFSGEHPWNDAPDTMRPRDWNTFALWQFSADGNGLGAAYGVESDDIDLNKGGAETLAGTLALLRGQPLPPPEPIGAMLLKFKAKYTLNIRSGPDTSYPDIGDLAKDTIVTALEIQPTDNNSVWVRIDTGKWVALVHNGGGPYLTFYEAIPLPPPVDVLYVQAATTTNLRWYALTNAQGKPIMALPPAENRPKFNAGAVVAVKPGVVDADGQDDYYEVLSGGLALPPTYQPPATYTGWFIRKNDVFAVTP